jgi:hypothetical protein
VPSFQRADEVAENVSGVEGTLEKACNAAQWRCLGANEREKPDTLKSAGLFSFVEVTPT